MLSTTSAVSGTSSRGAGVERVSMSGANTGGLSLRGVIGTSSTSVRLGTVASWSVCCSIRRSSGNSSVALVGLGGVADLVGSGSETFEFTA